MKNIKIRYIIGILTALVFVIVALLSYDTSAIEYSNFQSAKQSGKKVQIIGSWVKDQPTNYDPDKNLFSFHMNDKENNASKIVFSGPRPNNFEIANYFVVTGKYNGDEFLASDILTKCPSKYEGKSEDLKK